MVPGGEQSQPSGYLTLPGLISSPVGVGLLGKVDKAGRVLQLPVLLSAKAGCVRVWMFSHVLLFATPWTIACQTPLSLGILQARLLEWVAMLSSRGSSQPTD